jgi:hypothetical protein
LPVLDLPSERHFVRSSKEESKMMFGERLRRFGLGAVGGAIALLAGCGPGAEMGESTVSLPIVDPTNVGADEMLGMVTVTTWRGGCTGAVIGGDTVLTAAHCVCTEDTVGGNDCRPDVTVDFRPDPKTGRIGTVSGRATVHPNYNPSWTDRQYENDLAMIKLAGPIPSHVMPFVLGEGNVPTGSRVIVAGRGRTGSGCDVAAGPFNFDFVNIGGYEDTANKIMRFDDEVVCPGDSGGPVLDLAGRVLLGIHSMKTWTVTHGWVDKAMAVPRYLGWIRSFLPWQQTADVGFVDGSDWNTGWCTQAGARLGTGDFNGDRKADLYCYNPPGTANPGNLSVALAAPSRFTDAGLWLAGWCSHAGASLGTGDFNGDGRTDLYCHDPMGPGSAGNTFVALSTGSGFTGGGIWLGGWCSHGGASFGTGDFNADGRTDFYCHDPMGPGSLGNTWVATSTGSGFTGGGIWLGGWCSHGGATFATGDFDGDGRTDVYCHDPMGSGTPGNLWVATSTGGRLVPRGGAWLSGWCSHSGATFGAGDFNGDGKTDFYCHDPMGGQNFGNTWVATSTGTGFSGGHIWLSGWCSHGGALFGLGDFNGDHRTDLFCHDPPRGTTGPTNTWVALSTGGAFELDPGRPRLEGWCNHAGTGFFALDVTGDRATDFVCRDPMGPGSAGTTWVAVARPL